VLTVSLLGVPSALRQQLDAELSTPDVQVEDVLETDVTGIAPPPPMDAVVIGETLGDLLKIAQRLRAGDSAMGIVLIPTQGTQACELLDRARWTPFLGRNTQVSEGTAPEVVAALRQVMEETAKIQCNRMMVDVARACTAGPLRGVAVPTPEDLSALVEELPVGVLTVDAHGRILVGNRRTAQLLGIPGKSMVGALLETAFPEPAREHVRSLLADDGIPTPPRTLTTLAGTSLAVTVRVLARQSRGLFLVVLQDETARVEVERENVTLQTAVHAAEERMREAHKMEALGRLSGGIAHDFNNLLTAILAFAELALADLEPEHPSTDCLRQVVRAAERAAGLTAQLLALARRQVLQTRRQRLDDLVGDVTALLKRLLGEQIDVVLELNAKDAWVDVDAGQLQQVLMNLSVNARDSMPNGGRLTIGTELRRDTAEAVLTVADTGEGMTDAARAHLFEPFFTTKPVGQGTGLGLSVVDGIVAQSGGRITVETQLGLGSTFRIVLPACPAAEEVQSPVHPQRKPGVRARVLVVDDEPAVLQVTKAALEAVGHTVITAHSGAEALEALAQRKDLELLLTDVMMPGMNGVELARQATLLQPTLKVVFMSGHAGGETLQGLLATERDFLQKPFSLAELGAVVQTVLERP
jgi:PAS domain S-box-containing protein